MDGSERYLSCMREIKKRVNIIKWMLHKEMAIDHKLFHTEFISLQFRSITELILLANLSAHKTLYNKGCEKLKNEWRIKSILQFLKSVNTDFYPLPVTETFSEENPNIPIYLSLYTGFLSLEDLGIIYDTCNNYIHPKNPFAEERNYIILKIWKTKLKNRLLWKKQLKY